MEIWKQIIKRITAWNSTTELGDETLYPCKALDDEFVIFKRTHIREFTNLENGYSVYLINVEQAKEDAELDKWADKKEQEQKELNDSLSMSLDEKNDRIIRIHE